MSATLRIIPLLNLPLIEPGDDLIDILLPALSAATPANNDVLVIAQKIVSKAENRYVKLATVTPGTKAKQLALQADKDPRLVELILQQSEQVLRCKKGVIIVKHSLGFVHANAGIDHSNIEQGEDEQVLLLPQQPDHSARKLMQALREATGCHLGVIINDSFGRAWRTGTTGIAIGAAGVTCLSAKTGETDLMGNELISTEIAIADEIAAAASLVMGQANESIPAVLVKGLNFPHSEQAASKLIRPSAADLFL